MAAEALTTQVGIASTRSALAAPGRRRLRMLATLVQVVLGLVLVWASLGKIAHPHVFAGNVYAYGLMGANASLLVSVTLPWLELLTGVCLITGVFSDAALLVALGLFMLFAGLVAYALFEGLDISCGCFGQSSDGKVTLATLARNGVLWLGAVAGVLLNLRKST